MSKFHSNVSRRDFMKILGMSSVGIGGAALVAPVFHDLDEMMSSTSAIQKRPWYVKERPLMNPTVEIDWGMMNRFDRRNNAQVAHSQAVYYGRDRVLAMAAKGAAVVENLKKTQGKNYSLRFQALGNGLTPGSSASQAWEGLATPKKGITPAETGLPKWNGTPEENSKVLTAALRYFGSALNGYAELDNTWRTKLVLTYTRGSISGTNYIDSPWPPPDTASKPTVFENVDRGYATSNKQVIPNKNMWVIHVDTIESQSIIKLGQPQEWQANDSQLTRHVGLEPSMINFLKALGDYQVLDSYNHGGSTLNWGATAVLTGTGEQSRQDGYTLTPEFACNHNPGTSYTDFPLAPTNPIDAGMWKFCASCGKCAITCPSGSISSDKQPSWEIPPVNGKEDVSHNKGVKAFWSNMFTCRIWSAENTTMHGCGICHGECMFAQDSAAMVHTVIKSTIPTIGIFNSFFAKMGEQFGYGNFADSESWWDMSLPVYGIDTARVAYTSRKPF
ncbi:reductive dehalogenase [Dehalogenimonas etheniformans]|uniref:Reductive dehalogenase n=1 Tax=Dehalogenimonas etheniformans TaxID=1536648 RepID=A0A2P5P5K4_9CHLR|nr:reductive dehalogenase [Dehalogenimonas etheniformans]PPD57582.1 reductive dehalogenase [Dehalogenimonas etheniformans]QNT75920.1 reductive dehalogenase [Dehalogenimonas etheniformans]